MNLRDTEDTVDKVEPLALRHKKAVCSGPGDFDLGAQEEEESPYSYKTGGREDKRTCMHSFDPR